MLRMGRCGGTSVVLLLLYTALDFGNPLMPGAVSFEAGTIQVVPGDRRPEPRDQPKRPARPVTVLPVWGAVPLGAVSLRPTSLAPARLPHSASFGALRRGSASLSHRPKTTSSSSIVPG